MYIRLYGSRDVIIARAQPPYNNYTFLHVRGCEASVVIGGNFVRGMTVRDVRLVRYSEVRGVRISEVEMYGVHAVVGRGHAGCPL